MLLLLLVAIAATLLPATVLCEPVIAKADGVTRPYTVFNTAFGATAYEVPDCNHTSFGDHITQVFDQELNRYVFAFHLHKDYDDDRCEVFDRQRAEVKTYNPSPAYLKGFENETVSYSWNFKIPAGIKVTREFLHIHQVKYSGGYDTHPLYTITLNKLVDGSGDVLRYVYTNNDGVRSYVIEMPIYPFWDTWVHVYERITFGWKGEAFIDVRRISDNQQVFTYTAPTDTESWRTGTNFGRPKWGFYRNVAQTLQEVEDDTIWFDRFCIAKGFVDDCEHTFQ